MFATRGWTLASRMAPLGAVALGVMPGLVFAEATTPPPQDSSSLVRDWLGQDDLRIRVHSDEDPKPPATVGPLAVFAGSSNPGLAQEIAEELDITLGRLTSTTFADGERFVKVDDSVRGKDVFIVQSTSPPVNEHLMELLLVISTMRRASAKSITAVVPYYGYKRATGKKERSLRARGGRGGVVEVATPLSAADVAVMLEAMGVDSVISLDLQPPGEGQVEGFFGASVRVDNLRSTAAAVELLSAHPELKKTAIVAESEPCVELAHDVRSGLERATKQYIPFAVIAKTDSVRPGPRRREVVGDVEGCDVVIVGDLIDTALTIVRSVKALKAAGARSVRVFATHAVFSKDALELLSECKDLAEVIVTNTIPLSPDSEDVHKISQLSVAPLLASSISRAHRRQSLQALRVYDRENMRPRYGGQEG